MCWSDISPDISKKITMLKECHKLKALLTNCFKEINHLIDIIEENFPGQMLKKIYVQSSASLGDSCIIITERVNQIKKLLEEKEFDVESRMDTSLFKDLKDLNTRFEETIIKNSKRKLLWRFFIGFVIGFVLWKTFDMMGYTLTAFFLEFGIIESIVFVFLVKKVISVVIDTVVSAIYGASERELDRAVEEYARAVEDFEPVSCAFCWNIGKVSELIEVHNKK